MTQGTVLVNSNLLLLTLDVHEKVNASSVRTARMLVLYSSSYYRIAGQTVEDVDVSSVNFHEWKKLC